MSSSDRLPLLEHHHHVTPPDEEEGPSHSTVALRLVIRFVDRPDVTFVLPRHLLVKVVKEKLHAQLDLPQHIHLRLIYRGKLLEDQIMLSDYISSSSMCEVLNCAMSSYPPSSSSSVHTMEQRQESHRGFDRLRDMGFQETEIEVLRVQFHEFHRTFPSRDDLTYRLNEARLIEDEWIFSNVREDRLSREPQLSLFDPISHGALLARQTTLHSMADHDTLEFHHPHVTPVSEGDYTDLVIGLILGFFFGVIVLPFLYEKHLTLRHQMGIVAGLLVNLVFGIIKLIY